MTDHFSVIGFNASSAEELAELVRSCPKPAAIPSLADPAIIIAGTPIAAPSCGCIWPSKAARRDEKLSIVGVTPFFHGSGRMPVRVMKKRQRPDDNAFEGAVFVEIEPGPRPHQCATVALLDVVDYALWANRVRPSSPRRRSPPSRTIWPSSPASAIRRRADRRTGEVLAGVALCQRPVLVRGRGGGQAVFHDPSGGIQRSLARFLHWARADGGDAAEQRDRTEFSRGAGQDAGRHDRSGR